VKSLIILVGTFMLLAAGATLTASNSYSAGDGVGVAAKGKGPQPPPYTDPIKSDMSGGATATTTSTPTCPAVWYVVSSPNAEEGPNELYSVDAVSADDMWAVGYYMGSNGSHHERQTELEKWQSLKRGNADRKDSTFVLRTLVERWDGSQWTIVPSPNVGLDDNHLLSVDVVSENDVWAVGYYLNEFGVAQTLAEHWNGTEWEIVPSPNTTPLRDNELLSVQAVAADDVWAVGYYIDDVGVGQTLTIRWQGKGWTVVPSPNTGPEGNALHDLAIISAGDIWAIGFSISTGDLLRTLAMHWDGIAWTIVPSPNVGSTDNLALSIDAVSTDNVWAVGYYIDNRGVYRPLSLHWDGSAWEAVPVPVPTEEDYQFLWVDARSADDIWAVGRAGGYYYWPRSISAHWDGQTWSMVPTADFGPVTYNYLSSVVVIAPNDVWAVGRSSGYSYGYEPRTLTEHYTNTTSDCRTRFTDVPPTNVFYPFIHYLACRNIVSGYECGYPNEPCNVNNDPYFRPNTDITRGQIAKIVGSAAGLNDDPGPRIFQDVDGYSGFYPWINRLARRGILGGYPCGSLSWEPCIAPDNKPYFRPYNDTTRGQLAKIISNAAGYNEPHTAQTFQDVPTSHAFYIWIERLSAHGSIGGYRCGTQDEPCVPPANRPYFRPNANVTRGQTAKIAASTFFPACVLATEP
jgi:hypothetical protein